MNQEICRRFDVPLYRFGKVCARCVGGQLVFDCWGDVGDIQAAIDDESEGGFVGFVTNNTPPISIFCYQEFIQHPGQGEE
jgi:hypothetical protein